MAHFIGREREMLDLTQLRSKKRASLVCVTGRRRIGKSTLIREFGKSYRNHFSVQGLAPQEVNAAEKNSWHGALRDQLRHFSDQVSRHFDLPKVQFQDWSEALTFLANKTKNGKQLVVLDEVSWMAHGDPLFSSRLKDVWDTQFSQNPNLILIVCGSVSSWIQDNILNHTNFVGRVSLSLNLQELPLEKLNMFWPNSAKISSFEKLLVLSVTGGVPKYLEEVVDAQTGEKNLLRLCFRASGILYSDFERIFRDIFGRRYRSMERIVRACLESKMSPMDLAKKIKVDANSEFYDSLSVLEMAGFIARDFYFKTNGDVSKLSRIRVKDNYLRFYLKYIEPNKERMKNKEYKSLFDLKSFESVLGLQFENLILSNISTLYPSLDLRDEEIVSAAPYLQKKNSQHKEGCQIDLLIHAKLNVFYMCEIKCKKTIDKTIITEVERKSRALKLPKRASLRPVLICEGEIYLPHLDEIKAYFFKIIQFSDLLSPLRAIR